MTLPRLALSVIGDEIGPSLDEMISFAHEHGLKRLDMRTVGGRNLLGMTKDEVIKISRALEQADLAVSAFVSPLFKWQAPGKTVSAGGVDFAFDPKQCPEKSIVKHAMQIAVILGAPHLRIFSYLRYSGFRPSDLGALTEDLDELLELAGTYDITLQLENEPVCNVGNIAELAHFFAQGNSDKAKKKAGGDDEDEDEDDDFDRFAGSQSKHAYLRPLVDIANAWSTGERPSDADIALLAPLTTAIHLKDRDLSAGRTVPLGDGDIPWPTELRRLLRGAKAKEVLASIETHCPQDSRNATTRSLAGFRRIADEIGVEVV